MRTHSTGSKKRMVPDITDSGQGRSRLDLPIRFDFGDIKRKAGLELIGFCIIFTCMILMRFGL